MVNYERGKIYKIQSDQCKKVYVGSTCKQYLSQRMSTHRIHYRSNDKGKSSTAFQILQYEDAAIILIEPYPCTNKKELLTRERYWIEQLDCVNAYLPGRSQKEYRTDNKPKVQEWQAAYRLNNKDHLAEYHKEYARKNSEHKKSRAKQWREDNPEQAKETKAAYYQRNKERIKLYQQANRERINATQRARRAKN